MMKRFRKMLALLLALAMSISIMAAPSFADEDEAKIELAVTTSAEEGANLKSGDTLTATITAPAPAEAVANGQLQMNFNKDILQATETGLTGHQGTLVLSNADDANTNGFVNAMFYDAGGDDALVMTDPVVLTVKFTVKENVYEGSYEDLITVEKEKTFFAKADDSKVEEEFGNTSFDADLDGEWHLVIPEGAPFDDVWTDVEGAKIQVIDTGIKVEHSGYNRSTTLYSVIIPRDVEINKVYFKFLKADGVSQIPMPQYDWNDMSKLDCWAQFGSVPAAIRQDLEDTDEYRSFSLDPSTAMDEDGTYEKSYKLWSSDSGDLCAIAFEMGCDHENVEHIEARAATCTSAGNIEYWKCNDCNRFFSDKKLKNRISEAQTVIDLLPHEYDEDQVCTMCNTRGTTTVSFVGAAKDRVSDKSADTENSGLDYKFKINGKGVVSEAFFKEEADKSILEGISSTWSIVTAKVYQLDDTTYNDKTIPNYSVHYPNNLSNAIPAGASTYTLVRPDGSTGTGGAGRRLSTEGQYYILNNGEPVVGIVFHKNDNAEAEYEPMEADEDGFYTIPAAKMIADGTVYINVDKWPNSYVEFTGDGAYKVTDKTEQVENAGEDFKFKAGNGIVTMDPGEAVEIPEHIYAAPGQENITFYSGNSVEVDGKTIPGYNMSFTGVFWLNGDNYDFEEDPNDEDYPLSFYGTKFKKDGQYASPGCNNYDTANCDGQYLVYEVKYTRGEKVVEDGDYWYEYDKTETPIFAINITKGEPGTMVPDDEGFYTIPGSMMKPNGTITVNVVKPPSSFVEFVGDGAYKVTDATEQDENAGKDFKFKAGDGIVSRDVEIVDTPVDVLNITNPENITFVKKGTVKIKGDDEDVPVEDWREYDVPDYDVYVSGSFRLDHKRVGGVDSDKYENRIYRSNRLDKYTETAVTGAGGEYIVFYEHDIQGSHSGGWHRKEFTPLFRMKVVEGSPVMTPDEDGFYTIPAKEMVPMTSRDEAIRIRILKQEYEKVENKIDEIGEVTLESEEAIVAAREAYEALSDEQKALVSNTHMMKLENAEQELALLKKKEENPELAEIIDAQIEAIKKTEERIAGLNAQIDALNEAISANEDEIDALNEAVSNDEAKIEALEAKVAELEGLLDELQDQYDELGGLLTDLQDQYAALEETVGDLSGSAAAQSDLEAINEDLQNKINGLNDTISGLNEQIAQMKDKAGTDSALDEKKAQAAETINKYLEDNTANMLPEDQLEAEVAALRGIIKANGAKDEAAVNAAVDEAKSAIDAKVQIKTDTDAAKALKVTGLKAKAKSRKFTVSWKKNAGAEAYQVQYKLKSAKKFSNLKKSVTKVSVKSKKLKKGKKYIFQVRTIKTVNGKKVYGKWVKTKAVKCK